MTNKLTAILLLILNMCLTNTFSATILPKCQDGNSIPEENSSYTLGPDDVITIKVYDNSDLCGDFKVATDGSIVYPILGQIAVRGLSAMEVQQEITKLLKKDYLYNPIVSVVVRTYKSQVVYILGNVGTSGVHYLDRPTKLFDLLSEANVLSKGKLSSGNNVRIIRQSIPNTPASQQKDTSFLISIYQFLNAGKKELNVYLQKGDIIYLPNIQMVHVIGEVKKPGSFNYEEGMTVLKAISLAGGRTNVSSQKNIIIKRIVNNKEKKIKVKMSDVLQPDDIIDVPLSVW